ncbi:MAG: M14 family metallopeptidase [Bacteroidetes bacterium]|nr:M14 family metallopeptidase [Bacteroidota bacterium]
MKIRYSFLLLMTTFSLFAQKEDFITHYEKSGFKETSTYDQTIEYCRKLDKASEWVHYSTFGISLQGKELPLLIIDKNSMKEAREVHQTEKAVVLIQAGIHAGEINGKDAGLMLIRDIVIHKKHSNLLNQITLVFIPIYNVDGHENFSAYGRINQNGPKEMGFRTNANNLNLNRDYMKADAAETQAWLKLFLTWLPDFFIDIHSTDGADYQYALTYGMETFGTMSPQLTSWQKDVFIKYVDKRMRKAKFPIFPYVGFRNWHDPRSGLKSWVGNPMFSQAYTAMQNRPGLLIESHMLKDYETRVSSTYEMLVHSLTILNKEYYHLQGLIAESELFVSNEKFRAKKFALSYKPTSDSTIVKFKGVEYDIVKSDLSGGDWVKYSKTPKTFDIPYFDSQVADKQVFLPEAYIIPQEWTEVLYRMKLHGIETCSLAKESKINVNTYKFANPRWNTSPYEGRQVLEHFDITEVEEERLFRAGSVIVKMDQPTAKVIAYLLEPQAQGSLIYWGFFNSIFEQKEYAESYVMEKLAREMLESDANLKAEFEEKLKNEAEFKHNWWLLLNWFYSKTPYWDSRINSYPVGRIMLKTEMEELEFTY